MKARLALITGISAAALLTGCAGASPAMAATTPTCTAADVQVDMITPDVRVARTAQLQLTIVGERPCTMQGFLTDLQFLDAGGRPMATAATTTGDDQEERLGGAPGEMGTVDLAWATAPGAPTPATLQLRLSGAEQTSEVDWTGGPVAHDGAVTHTVIVTPRG